MFSALRDKRSMCASRVIQGLVAGVCVTFLSGCETTRPKPLDALRDMPPEYTNAPATAVAGASSSRNPEWWKQFGSGELNDLVNRALTSNAELRGAQQQVIQAKLREQQARAGRLPSLTAPIRAVEQVQGNRTDSQNNSQLFLSGAYRLDVWGEQGALATAAGLQVQRAVHDKENLQRLLIGGLVESYIAYLVAHEGFEAARATQELIQQGLELTQQRLALGDATLDEVERQNTALALQHIVVAGFENQIQELRSTLSRYVGVLPKAIKVSATALGELRVPIATVGLPSSLLFDRPDIRAMEDRMRAADANIEVARARLLPPIDLTAQIGYSGVALTSLLQPQNLVASSVASLVVAIFDGGVKRAERDFAQSFYDEMVIAYGKTILQAIREVETALMGVRTAARKYDAQAVVMQSAHRMLNSGSEAYRAGALDRFTLLEYRKNYQRSTDDFKRAKADVLRSYVSLSVALGWGGDLGDSQVNESVARVHTNGKGTMP